MKKLLMGIFGLTLLLPLGVFAEVADIDSVEEGNNSANAEVTVGNVAVPVYSVELTWMNLSFDWVYDSENNTYGWVSTPSCEGYPPYGEGINIETDIREALASGKKLYTNNTCTNQIYEYDETVEEYYYSYTVPTMIEIVDRSENGAIQPSITWNSTDEYSYVNGKFSYYGNHIECAVVNDEDESEYLITKNITIYDDNNCNNIAENVQEYIENKYYVFKTVGTDYTTPIEMTSDLIPLEARTGEMGYVYTEFDSPYHWSMYVIELDLENKEQPTTTPTAGDTLGTITVSIRAAE